MAEPIDPKLSLRKVANRGTLLVSLITKYLSTLPHPIEVLEELVAVVSVTSSLLQTLDATITRFYPTTKLCTKTSFLNPLSRDILTAFNQFGQKVSEAQRFKVFEPNEVGLVRVPLNGWTFIMGGEARVKQLRSRLYVEKYRVRVLIDSVAWCGLRDLGAPGRTIEQEREMELLKKMLPLLAERLTGVWNDYKLRVGDGGSCPVEVKFPRRIQQVVEMKKESAVVVQEVQDDLKKGVRFSIHDSPSTTSISSSCSSTSSMTIMDDSILERWVLRCNEAKRTLTKQTKILGIPLHKTYQHTSDYYYVKPLASHPSEIEDFVTQQTKPNNKSKNNFHKTIPSLPEDAQKELQKLIERRQDASSNSQTKRSFEIIAFASRPRRKISALTVAGSKKKWWSRKQQKTPLEWILVLKGETIDQLPKSTPVKHDDAWNPKPKPKPVGGSQNAQASITATAPVPTPQQSPHAHLIPRPAPGAHVLRHVEQRRGMGVEEAERRVEEILGGLMKYEEAKYQSGDDNDNVGSDNEQGEEHVKTETQK